MKQKKLVAGFVLALFFYNCALAQQDSASRATVIKKHDSVKQLDLVDIVALLFKLHLSSKLDTGKIPPGHLLFSFAPAVGYTVEGAEEVSLSINASFYTSDPNNTYLSVINTGGQYSIRKQLMVPLISQVWLPGNKYELLGDWRYYKYPSFTYGLGDTTKLSRSDFIDYSYLKFYQEILRHFSSNYYIGVGYNLDDHFNIADNNPVTDFPDYNGTATHTTSSGLVAQFMYDNRSNPNNPKQAFYGSITYRYNSTLLGSDENWQYVLLEARKYFRLSKNKVLAFWSYNEFTFGGMAPYLDLPSNGWDTYSNTGRGYIQGRFRGPAMVYDEAEFRFGILKNGLIGGVLFANGETYEGWPKETFGPIYPGYGFGVRIKFNKYSDVNVCIDYGFGIQGSNGLFFNLGEVF